MSLARQRPRVHLLRRMVKARHESRARPAAVRLEDLFDAGEDGVDIALGAALIARDVYDDLDVRAVLAQFDELAAPLVRLGLGRMNPRAQALEMAHYVYERQGFAGNETSYYDPKNSLLPDVLERRLGIPITLALVYCEIGRRVGVRARGISFPGHFLVRIDGQAGATDGTPIVIDPFFGGRMLDERSIASLFRRVAGPTQKMKPEHLLPASPRVVLTRMLTNLKTVYLARGETCRAMLALDRLLSFNPEQASLLRERGLLAARLGSVEVARGDLNRFLELDPRETDLNEVRTELERLSASRHWLN
jgi:regulator of sirC expression with transglutaminase-like and TPR domain